MGINKPHNSPLFIANVVCMYEMGLKINTLIEVAESVVYDEQIGFAAEISKPVQIMTDEEGNKYELKVVLTLIENGEKQNNTKGITD